MPEWLNYYAVPTLSDMVAEMGTFREELNNINNFRYTTSKMDNTAAQQTTELSAAMEQLLAEALDNFDEPHIVRSLSNQHASRTTIYEQREKPIATTARTTGSTTASTERSDAAAAETLAEPDASRANCQPSQMPAEPDADRTTKDEEPDAAEPDAAAPDAAAPDAVSMIADQSSTRHSYRTADLNEAAGLMASQTDRLTSPFEKATDLNEAATTATAAATVIAPKSLCMEQHGNAAMAASLHETTMVDVRLMERGDAAIAAGPHRTAIADVRSIEYDDGECATASAHTRHVWLRELKHMDALHTAIALSRIEPALRIVLRPTLKPLEQQQWAGLTIQRNARGWRARSIAAGSTAIAAAPLSSAVSNALALRSSGKPLR